MTTLQKRLTGTAAVLTLATTLAAATVAPAQAAGAATAPKTTAQATGTAAQSAASSPKVALPAAAQPRVVVLYNVVTGRCADIPAFDKGYVGAPVTQFYCRPGAYDNQQFVLLPRGKVAGKYDRFLIQNRKDRLCLDLPNYGKVPKGTPVSEYHCRMQDNQLFYRKPVRGGDFLVHEKTGMCLDVAGLRSRQANTRLLLWPCSMNDEHVWRLLAPSAAPVQAIPAPPAPPAPAPPKPPTHNGYGVVAEWWSKLPPGYNWELSRAGTVAWRDALHHELTTTEGDPPVDLVCTLMGRVFKTVPKAKSLCKLPTNILNNRLKNMLDRANDAVRGNECLIIRVPTNSGTTKCRA